jgi:hypothetical protein
MAKHMVLQKYFVYDPGVHAGDELGGMRVHDSDEGLHVLASPMQMQYWIDQGLLGTSTLDKLSDGHKKLLGQITRGRSESDDDPKRVPKYSKRTQSGSPSFAATPASVRMKERNKAARKAKLGDKANEKRGQASRQAAAHKRDAPSHPIISTTPAE